MNKVIQVQELLSFSFMKEKITEQVRNNAGKYYNCSLQKITLFPPHFYALAAILNNSKLKITGQYKTESWRFACR